MVYIVIAILLVGVVLSVYRLRPGGPGPAVNGVPRPFRNTLNSIYRRRGWQQPYDDQGHRSADRSAL